MKDVLILLWIFLLPLLALIWAVWEWIFENNQKKLLSEKEKEKQRVFKKLFVITTGFVISLMLIFGPLILWTNDFNIRAFLDLAFLLEVLLFDICSAIFLLLATKWFAGVLGFIFYSSHVSTILDFVLNDTFPMEMLVLCVLLYPIASWVQFKQVAFLSNKDNIQVRRN